MSCGLPVISTNGFGVNEVFNHLEHGIKIDVDDVTALRNAILLLLKNPDMRKKMGENGRKLVLEHYSIEKAIERELNIYKQLLESA